jgi:hypothetical protein
LGPEEQILYRVVAKAAVELAREAGLSEDAIGRLEAALD